MPFIEVSIAEGRTDQQLRHMVSELHRSVEKTVGATPENTTVIVREVAESLWSKGDRTIAEGRRL